MLKIYTQNRNCIDFPKRIEIKEKSKDDYKYNWWLVSNNDTILGCYETYPRAKEVLTEIYESNRKSYKMPQN